MPPLVAETVSDHKVSYRGLRGWLDEVSRMGELLQVNGAHWDVEMGALTHMLTEKSSGTAPAILFDDIPGYPKGFRTLYGHFSSIRRVALTLGLPLLCRSHALAEASSKPVEIGFAYEGIAPAGAVRAKALQEGLPPGASRKAATSLS